MKIHAIGGYSEFGRNMTAVTVGNETVIFDIGVAVDQLIRLQERGVNPEELPPEALYVEEVIPDDRAFFKKYGKQVKAIVIDHAHLDHVAGADKIAEKYNVPVIATAFTLEVLKQKLGKKSRLFKHLVQLNAKSTYKISDKLSVEFIYATHSIPQTVMSCLHTSEGDLLYAVDFKFDEHPVLGQKTDYKRLRELAAKGVKALITDSTRVDRDGRTYSESVFNNMIEDTFSFIDSKNKAVITTTFASHIARLTTLIKTAIKMKRTPVLLGRSMFNYVTAAENVGLVNITKEAILVHPRQNDKMFKEIERNGRGNYFLIMTGHQGEPNSMLVRLSQDTMSFKLLPDDIVVFCSETIPSPINEANKSRLIKSLKSHGVRIFDDVHVSGHVAREGMREFLKMIKPQHYIPSHGGLLKLSSAVKLANELGYKLGEDVHLLQDGQELDL
ncbi:MAG: MBL fold metallo-hydrolase [Candidatus Nanoarchaeia archaeon]|jgi:ribonuclease J